MCLVAVAWRAHPQYPLIVAGNRDEYHDRPAAPAAWWDDQPAGVFGGRDLVAGGSWLAVNRGGRFAVVLNNPQRPPGPTRTASRGHLVRDFVAGSKPSGRYLDAVQVNAQTYAGFCLLLGTAVQVRGFMSPSGSQAARWTLQPGVAAFSNSPPAQPWPKVGYLEQALAVQLQAPHPESEDLFSILSHRDPVTGSDTDGHPVSRMPFVVGAAYGTRASTVLMISTDNVCTFIERRFGADGHMSGMVREQFTLA